MLAAPAAPRNSLRSLRELRSDNRGESEVRGALRAPAGTAALLGCAQARRQRAARAFARSAAALAANFPVAIRTPQTLHSRQAAGGRAAGRGARARRRGAALRRVAGRPGAMSAAPSSAASGSARAARFVPLTRGDCPSAARAASGASFAARPRGEQRRAVGAQHRPPRPSPRPARRHAPRAAAAPPALRPRAPPPRPGPLPPAATRQRRNEAASCQALAPSRSMRAPSWPSLASMRS